MCETPSKIPMSNMVVIALIVFEILVGGGGVVDL